MAQAFREGHIRGDGVNWIPLWGQITLLPSESGPLSTPFDSESTSANLIVYVNQGDSGDLTKVRLGNSGDGRHYIAEPHGQCTAVIPLSPGDPEPEILSPADIYVDFRVEVL
ncbi:MAG: hypothetical protein ACFCA4_12630 [Cyanophyceae cyanobacterium]